jgi:hypothetical protein
MSELSLTRVLLSAYYMSILIFISIFSIFDEFIIFMTSLFSNILFSILNIRIEGTDNVWWSLLLVSFGIVFAIKQSIVSPLGFYVNADGSSKWESYALVILVLGCLIYNINILFPNYPMPQIFPNFMVKILNGYRPNLPTSTSDYLLSNLVAPILWNVGPIVLMWIMHLRSKLSPS